LAALYAMARAPLDYVPDQGWTDGREFWNSITISYLAKQRGLVTIKGTEAHLSAVDRAVAS
jgi:hypothetical protein